jgi:hypothetical protein
MRCGKMARQLRSPEFPREGAFVRSFASILGWCGGPAPRGAFGHFVTREQFDQSIPHGLTIYLTPIAEVLAHISANGKPQTRRMPLASNPPLPSRCRD